jgi:hypothetical protein
MKIMKFEVSAELLQKILDYIGGSTSNQPVVKIIGLVDEIRALKPMEVKGEEKDVQG